ncbi:uncharacterized protein LOC144176007 isoform X1 [Haemaphysalis longicornis]
MGSQLSSEVLGAVRHTQVFSELTTLTYERFFAKVDELNHICQYLTDSKQRRLVFEVHCPSETPVLWKNEVRVTCTRGAGGSGGVLHLHGAEARGDPALHPQLLPALHRAVERVQPDVPAVPGGVFRHRGELGDVGGAGLLRGAQRGAQGPGPAARGALRADGGCLLPAAACHPRCGHCCSTLSGPARGLLHFLVPPSFCAIRAAPLKRL